MLLRIETPPEKKLIGMSMAMSFTNIKTPLLWLAFRPRLIRRGGMDTRKGSLKFY
jgi:hypothetical protein